MKMFKRLVTNALAVTTILIGSVASADVRLPRLISDHMMLQRNQNVRIWGWADAGEVVTVAIAKKQATVTTSDNGQWEVMLPSLKTGGPYEMTVSGNNKVVVSDILVGEIWVCSGQSNMEWSVRSSFEPDKVASASTDAELRMFTVTKAVSDTELADVTGSWEAASPATTPRFSAVGYHFAKYLRQYLGCPVGMIHTSWGGTRIEAWTSPATNLAAGMKQSEFDPGRNGDANKASVLYNAMLVPVAKYTVSGALWYQGESNAGNPAKYRTQLPQMVADWRNAFQNQKLVFLPVQLAPFIATGSKKTDYAEIREAQSMAAEKDKRVGVAVITDVGEERDIHPRKKEPVGERLALQAARIAYGKKNDGASPSLRKARYYDGYSIVSFNNVGAGLVIKGGMISENALPSDKLMGFQIGGADGVWYDADAKIIDRDRVELSHASVAKPTKVRFAFINFPLANLFSIGGLPAEPFRTDRP
ncbi:MAG: sialate O-acetylesterase [Planctomycetota bacterium]|nr:MAG: sialate O-acetylesterase [Planctomycetota bacterium]